MMDCERRNGEWTRLVTGRLPGIQYLQARFTHHAYQSHSHENAYVVGWISDGVQEGRYEGRRHRAPKGTVVLISPGEVHDGYTTSAGGYTYHSLHIDNDQVGPDTTLEFPQRVVADTHFRRKVINLCALLADQGQVELDREAALVTLVSAIHAQGRRSETYQLADSGLTSEVRDYLHAHFRFSDLTIAQVAERFAISRSHLTRAFHRRYGLPPHAYLNNIRLEEARQMLLVGRRPAEVAADVGFVDQSHLTRRIKAVFGVTPGQIAKSVQ